MGKLMFGAVFVEAVRAPFRDPDWLRKSSLGGVLSLVPALVLGLLISVQMHLVLKVVMVVFGLVPMFVAWGYLYRVFVDSLNGLEWRMLPEWGDWKGYGGAGFWLFLIVLGYVLIAAVGLMGVISVLGLLPVDGHPERLSALLLLVMVTSAVLYGFFPLVFARFAAEGRIWTSFDPGTLFADIRTVVEGNYIRGCLSFYGLSLMGNLVMGGLPYIGLPLVSIYLFYVMVVFARIFGKIIGEARQKAQFQPPEKR